MFFCASEFMNIHSRISEYLEQRGSVVVHKSPNPPCSCDPSSPAASVAEFPILSAQPKEGAGAGCVSRSLQVSGITHQSKSCERSSLKLCQLLLPQTGGRAADSSRGPARRVPAPSQRGRGDFGIAPGSPGQTWSSCSRCTLVFPL